MDALSDFLADSGLEGLCLYADGVHSIARPTALQHFAGLSPRADNNCLLLAASGERRFLTDLPSDVARVERHTGVEAVEASHDFDRDLRRALSELGIEASVGLAGLDRIPTPTYRSIETAVDEVEVVDDRVDALAAEKDEAVLETFRELGRIADVGFRAAYGALRPGIKEYELAAEIEGTMRAAGADDNFNLLSSGEHNRLMHPPTDRIVREGDTVLFEISPSIDGLVVQICRTVSVGTAAADFAAGAGSALAVTLTIELDDGTIAVLGDTVIPTGAGVVTG